MGAISDYLNFGSTHRLHLIFMAVCIAIIGTQFLLYYKRIHAEHISYITQSIPVLSHIVGGLIFGFGMMFASGCPTQHCFNLGQGQLKALLVIPIVAISAQLTSTGVLAHARIGLDNIWRIPHIRITDIHAYAGIIFGIVVYFAYSIFLVKFLVKRKEINVKAIFVYGSLVGCIVIAMWYITGHLAFIEQDENTLDYAYIGNSGRNIQGLSMILPYMQLFDWLMYASDELRIFNASIMLMLGLIMGGFITQITQNLNIKNKIKETSLKQYTSFKTVKDFAQVFLGSICMGIGGVLSLGCSIGQGLSGLSVLSLASFITVMSIFIGAKIAYRYI
jgi:uncharacterized protein